MLARVSDSSKASPHLLGAYSASDEPFTLNPENNAMSRYYYHYHPLYR